MNRTLVRMICIYLVFFQLIYPYGRVYALELKGERVFFIRIYSEDIREDESQGIFNLLVEEINKKGELLIISGKEEEDKQNFISKGRAFYEKGKKHYERIELKEALEEFKKAAPILEEAFELSEGKEILKHLFMYLALSYMALGERAKGIDYLRRVNILDSNFDPDPFIYPPFIREELVRQRDILNAPASSALVVESEPTGADVMINGKFYGKTPVVIRGLSIGRYEVTLKYKGYKNIKRFIYITGGDPIRLAEEMQPDEVSNMINQINNAIIKNDMESAFSGMENLSRLLKVEKILLGILTKDLDRFKMEAMLIDSFNRKIINEANISFSHKERLKYIKELTEKLSLKQTSQLSEIAESRPFYKSFWFIVLVGIVAIAAGALALAGGGGGGGGGSSSSSTGSVTVNF